MTLDLKTNYAAGAILTAANLNTDNTLLETHVNASIKDMGAYNAPTTYYDNDSVTDGGSRWLAKRESTGVTPVAGADWELLTAGGAGTVTEVTGTAPIAVADGTTEPVISIDAATTSDPGSMSAADKTLIDAATDAATVSTLMKRDASGRAKVAAPSAGGDIVNLTTLETHSTAAAPHSGHLKADGTVAWTAGQDGGGFKLENIADGVLATDAATVGQLGVAAAGFAPRLAVRVATAAALPANTRSTNTLTANALGSINNTGIDGVTNLAVGDRVLVKDEAVGANNGVYSVTTVGSAGAAWVMDRVGDFDASGDATLGAYYPVSEGATLADTAWYLATDSVTLNTTALVFTKDATGGSGEVNTMSNLGTGSDVFKTKSGVDFQMRTLVEGDGIDITENTNDLTIAVDPTEFTLDEVAGTLDETKGGTGLTSYTLGDTCYASAANTLAKLAGNTTTTRKFLRQTGTGAVSAAPFWDTFLGSDIPAFGASGAGHTKGGVPDPGATAGTSKYLREDSSWVIPPGSGGWEATSTTSVTIPASLGGSKVWNIGAGYAFTVGQHIRAAKTSAPTTDYIGGIVTAYSAGNITITVDEYAGAVAAHTDWALSIGGAPGTLSINNLTAETTIADGDELALYDVSAGANRKMTRANFLLSQPASNISTGTLALARGGTNADLSATGGAVNTTGKQVLVQGADNVIGPRALIAADLPNTAVTPGSYTAADITVDAQGRITAAANGSGGGSATLDEQLVMYVQVFS